MAPLTTGDTALERRLASLSIRTRYRRNPDTAMAGGKKGEKLLTLGSRLKYPIKITKLYKSAGEKVKRQEPVLQYSFQWLKELHNKDTGELETQELTSLAEWNAPEDGQLIAWHLQPGQVVASDSPCITVEEACTHEIQFQGLCALCGKDMNEVNWASEHRDTERAPINMTHDQTSLTVSQMAAAKAENELQRRLIQDRKLSLVVDLDQTIIHACIEPTIGEWQRDPSNPNHEAVKDVKSFQLNDDGPRGLASGCWYYIKMRPGLHDFLKRVAEKYELHVYTMGTRAYAMNVAKLVDPDQALFANRVISRDENGSMTAKSLQRLFPVSTNMVVIIDDRADVWPRNRPNLIKVTPYDFFKGIGDINSSFLPKREDLLKGPPGAPPPAANGAQAQGTPEATVNGTPDKMSALEELARMSGGDDTMLIQKQTEEQERTLEKQIKDRPLAHLQAELDKEDSEATPIPAPNGDQPQQTPVPHRHHLLLDNDQELAFLEKHLLGLHETFYEEYDAQNRGRSSRDIPLVPDVGHVLDKLKAKVLKGTSIVLSGIIPLGYDVRTSEIGLQVQSFGASLHTRVGKHITHLVISSDRPRTAKVRQAAQIPHIKIVNQNWLADSLSQWTKLDETPYLVRHRYISYFTAATITNTQTYQIDVHPADRAKAAATNETTDAETISDADDSDDPTGQSRNKFRIIVSDPSGQMGEDDDDEDADDGDDDDDGEDEEEEEERELDDASSPMDDLKTFDWADADAELAEFLADEDGDESEFAEDGKSEMESEAEGEGDTTLLSAGGTKRKHEEDSESDGDGSRTESLIAKKQRIARNRGASGLREVQTPGGGDGAPNNGADSLPTPQVNGGADMDLRKQKAGMIVADNQDDIDDAQLEADLMAELEADEAEAAATASAAAEQS
ncbi:uncharacterized protein E0L32_000735 [Thyridium curvatum]|uniref:RNA polymerase II subunit A C-terminal domain phosphatase n=1 Tax=Thyridium curvatum TaxID=1093900 RepID=A0A507B711_9PEZI|nr:uncharacterized protein E0L32_000735 [Thyridium curvatum]TPX12558.1 hypothetical protein E0L32_000735 [Thyridium curvatum]